MKTLILIASALAAVPTPASASVEPQSESRSLVVPLGDLNLSTPSGEAALKRRIDAAVRQVCYETGPPSTQRQHRMAECIASASGRVRLDVDRAVAAARISSTSRLAEADGSWR